MEKNYPQGFFFNLPDEKAPDFVLGKVSFHKEKFLKWLQEQKPTPKGYVKLNIKRGRESGEPYATIDEYDPDKPRTAQTVQRPVQTQAPVTDPDVVDPDDIPF